MDAESLFALQFASTWFMTGLIWFVQVVHYPLAAEVGEAAYVRYQGEHMRRTTWVVGPAMLVEGVTAVGAIWRPPPGIGTAGVWLGIVMLVGIWASTALLQVPAHDRLARGFDRSAHGALVRWNWLRTGLWSARALTLLSAVAWSARALTLLSAVA